MVYDFTAHQSIVEGSQMAGEAEYFSAIRSGKLRLLADPPEGRLQVFY